MSKLTSSMEMATRESHIITAWIMRWAAIDSGAFLILAFFSQNLLVGYLLILYLLFLRPSANNWEEALRSVR
jgi:hypothetical protein